jgi:acetyl esterase/lipase
VVCYHTSNVKNLLLTPGRRRRGAIAAAVAILLLATAVSLFVASPAPHTAKKALTRASITIRMAGATTHRDIPYCGDSSGSQQQLDLYVPKSGTAAHPLVVFIHGGGWSRGDKTDPIVSAYGPAIVKQGDALASVNYRLAPHYTYPTQDQDVACAISYLYGHAAGYGLDRSRLALFGASAGGQLAAYAALATADQGQPWHASLRGVIDFYGISDLTKLPPRFPSDLSTRHFLGPEGADHSVAASPVTYTSQSAPPFLIFHGDEDQRVPLAQSQELARDLQAGGNTATLVVVSHAGHGFGRGAQPSVGQIRQQLTGFLAHVFST